jgi:hypothetical protein
MYKEHDRTTVVIQLKRDLVPGIPTRRRSIEDFLAGEKDDANNYQPPKERKIQMESNSRPATAAVEMLQSWDAPLLENSGKCVSSISCSRRKKRSFRRPSCHELTKRSLSCRDAFTLPTITEFCSLPEEAFSPGPSLANSNWPALRRRQSLRSYTKLLSALSMGSKDNQDDDNTPSQEARWEPLSSTITSGLSNESIDPSYVK